MKCIWMANICIYTTLSNPPLLPLGLIFHRWHRKSLKECPCPTLTGRASLDVTLKLFLPHTQPLHICCAWSYNGCLANIYGKQLESTERLNQNSTISCSQGTIKLKHVFVKYLFKSICFLFNSVIQFVQYNFKLKIECVRQRKIFK